MPHSTLSQPFHRPDRGSSPGATLVVQGARSFYDTVIKRGEEVLAEVKSSWCCIDAETLRPARIAAEIQEYFFPKD